MISRVRGRCQTLQLRVSSPIRGGYKLMARKGSMAQEVFVVTELTMPSSCGPLCRRINPDFTMKPARLGNKTNSIVSCQDVTGSPSCISSTAEMAA